MGRYRSRFNGKLLAGGGILLAVVLMGLLGPLFWDLSQARVASCPLNLPPFGFEEPGPGFQPAQARHPLGTESSGRDMLALLISGTPNSLMVGVIAAALGVAVGVLLGLTAGFLGGWMDAAIRTAADSLITIPSLAVLIVISSYVREIDVRSMGLLLALFAWPGPTRVIRAQVLSLRERGYVQMARLSGVSTFGIVAFELLPNLMPYVAANFTGSVSANILAATGLEALGLGPSRVPTLGMTIFYAIRGAAILRGMWWWWGLPILMLIIIFVGLFLVTIGLDEVANPRLKGIRKRT
jgi:peptide/nickel transport system permease protein